MVMKIVHTTMSRVLEEGTGRKALTLSSVCVGGSVYAHIHVIYTLTHISSVNCCELSNSRVCMFVHIYIHSYIFIYIYDIILILNLTATLYKRKLRHEEAKPPTCLKSQKVAQLGFILNCHPLNAPFCKLPSQKCFWNVKPFQDTTLPQKGKGDILPFLFQNLRAKISGQLWG